MRWLKFLAKKIHCVDTNKAALSQERKHHKWCENGGRTECKDKAGSSAQKSSSLFARAYLYVNMEHYVSITGPNSLIVHLSSLWGAGLQ